jgi:hypothetical protein
MRDWLKQHYPNGIGLGDLVREYVETIECAKISDNDRVANEFLLRSEEIRLVLNYLNYTKCTPTFSEDFSTVYLNDQKVNL